MIIHVYVSLCLACACPPSKSDWHQIGCPTDNSHTKRALNHDANLVPKSVLDQHSHETKNSRLLSWSSSSLLDTSCCPHTTIPPPGRSAQLGHIQHDTAWPRHQSELSWFKKTQAVYDQIEIRPSWANSFNWNGVLQTCQTLIRCFYQASWVSRPAHQHQLELTPPQISLISTVIAQDLDQKHKSSPHLKR